MITPKKTTKTKTARSRKTTAFLRNLLALPAVAGTAIALPLAVAQPAFAQGAYESETNAYEWEADEGWHEEEWYDPSDWFDDEPYDDYMNTYDYESDDWGYGYDNDYYDNDYYDTGYYDDSLYDTGYDDDEYYSNYRDTQYGTGYYDTGYYDDDYYQNNNEYDYGYGDRDNVYYGNQPFYRTQNQRSMQGQQNQPDRMNQDAQRNWQQNQRSMQNRQYDQRNRMNQDTQRNWQQNQRSMQNRQYDQRNRMNQDAQRNWQRQSDQQRSQSNWRSSQSGMNQQATLSGRLQRIQRANQPIEGHTLYRVRMDNGQTRVLALEPNQASRIRMNRGDRVQIKGTQEMLQNKRVLKVSDIKTQSAQSSNRSQRQGNQWQGNQRQSQGNQWQGNQRQSQDSQWQSGQSDAQQQTLSGTLDRVERANRQVQGHTLYRVRMDNGQTRVLALEPNQASRLRMNEGDRVQIKGKQEMLQNKRVIKVSDIKTQSSQSSNQSFSQMQRQGNRQGTGWNGGQYWSTQARSSQQNTTRSGQQTADRSGQQTADRSGWQTDWRSGSQSGQQTIDGRLSSIERSLRDVQGYALFRVRTDDGQTKILAVRPDNASKLRNAQGERIRIKGERATVGDQQVIKVTEINKRSDSN